MKEWKFPFPAPVDSSSGRPDIPVDDGDIIQISFSTALCDHLEPSGIFLALYIEGKATHLATIDHYKFSVIGKNSFTEYDISKYKTEPNIILTLVKSRQEDSELLTMSVNGQHKGEFRHFAPRSGRVDGMRVVHYGDDNPSRSCGDMPVIGYAVFTGPNAVDEAKARLDALRNFPAFQETLPPCDRTNKDRKRAMEDGKSEVGDHDETSGRKEEGTGPGADSGQSSNTNIPPGNDYTKMQDASSIVWRRAVNLTLGSSVYENVKATHDGIMAEWVKTRGGKLTPNDYDYLVYSAGFGWPDAIQKVGTDADFSKVREKYMEIIKYF